MLCRTPAFVLALLVASLSLASSAAAATLTPPLTPTRECPARC